MSQLALMKCEPCTPDSPKLPDEEINRFLSQVPEWKVNQFEETYKIERTYYFNKFLLALSFAHEIGEMAEFQKHYPIIQVQWGQTKITLFTPIINGIHMNDFIMAAKSDQIYEQAAK